MSQGRRLFRVFTTRTIQHTYEVGVISGNTYISVTITIQYGINVTPLFTKTLVEKHNVAVLGPFLGSNSISSLKSYAGILSWQYYITVEWRFTPVPVPVTWQNVNYCQNAQKVMTIRLVRKTGMDPVSLCNIFQTLFVFFHQTDLQNKLYRSALDCFSPKTYIPYPKSWHGGGIKYALLFS